MKSKFSKSKLEKVSGGSVDIHGVQDIQTRETTMFGDREIGIMGNITGNLNITTVSSLRNKE